MSPPVLAASGRSCKQACQQPNGRASIPLPGQRSKAGDRHLQLGEPVSGGGIFPVRNGQTTGSITVAPPGPGSFSCPNGQTLVLASISYTNIVLQGAAGDTASVPGTLSRVFFAV